MPGPLDRNTVWKKDNFPAAPFAHGIECGVGIRIAENGV